MNAVGYIKWLPTYSYKKDISNNGTSGDEDIL